MNDDSFEDYRIFSNDCSFYGKDCNLFFINKNENIKVFTEDNDLIVEYEIAHKYLMIERRFYISQYVINKKYIGVYIDASIGTDEKFGIYFFDDDSNQLFSSLIDNSKNYMFEVPLGSSYVKISMKLKGISTLRLRSLHFSFVDFKSTHIIPSKKHRCLYRMYIENLPKKNNGVLIFFPGAYEHNKTWIIPFPNYCRSNWFKDLSNFCCICVSDPFMYSENCFKTNGSWFIDNLGKSVLIELSQLVNDLIGNDRGRILCHGSSMGGYAAFLFSCLIGADFCISECMQSNLLNYSASKELCRLTGADNFEFISLSKICNTFKPSFYCFFHFYSLDSSLIYDFFNEYKEIYDDVKKKMNLHFVIENNQEHNLFYHDPMPKNEIIRMIYKLYGNESY